MAEVAAVATVIGLAGAGITLSKTLYQMGAKVVTAEHNINRVATNVALFSSMLKSFGGVLKETESLHTPECLATADQIARECGQVFDEITNMAVMAGGAARDGRTGSDRTTPGGGQRRRRLSTALHRMKWYFEQPTVERLLAQLEYLKTTLSVLIQTLNLAVTTASAKRLGQISDQITQEIINERVHVETLIVARQLSIIMLQQYNSVSVSAADLQASKSPDPATSHPRVIGDEPNAEIVGRISPAITEDLEDAQDSDSNTQKLLTQAAHDSAVVRVGGGNLEFLDRAMDPVAQDHFTSAITPSHNQIIDQLLGRWTTLPQVEEELNRRQRQQHLERAKKGSVEENSLDDSYEIVHRGDSGSSVSASPIFGRVSDIPSEGMGRTPPPLSKADARPKDAVPYAPHPSSTPQTARVLLDPALTVKSPEAIGDGNQRTSLLPPPSTTPVPASSKPPRPSLSPHLSNSSLPPPPKANASRSIHRSKSPNLSTNSAEKAPGTSLAIDPSRASPPRGGPDFVTSPIAMNQSASMIPPSLLSQRATSDRDFYTPRPSSSHDQGSQQTGLTSHHTPPSSQSADDEHTSDDDDDEIQQKFGLGIPWRIRIGKQYFDFLDERLVGPRTPYLPTEPMSWVYAHDNAQTEISEQWVRKEALEEKRYAFSTVQLGDSSSSVASHGGRSSLGGVTTWKISQPLKFSAIEDLVERSAEMYRQQASTLGKSPQAPTAQPSQSTQQPAHQSQQQQLQSQPQPSSQLPPNADNGPPRAVPGQPPLIRKESSSKGKGKTINPAPAFEPSLQPAYYGPAQWGAGSGANQYQPPQPSMPPPSAAGSTLGVPQQQQHLQQPQYQQHQQPPVNNPQSPAARSLNSFYAGGPPPGNYMPTAPTPPSAIPPQGSRNMNNLYNPGPSGAVPSAGLGIPMHYGPGQAPNSYGAATHLAQQPQQQQHSYGQIPHFPPPPPSSSTGTSSTFTPGQHSAYNSPAYSRAQLDPQDWNSNNNHDIWSDNRYGSRDPGRSEPGYEVGQHPVGYKQVRSRDQRHRPLADDSQHGSRSSRPHHHSSSSRRHEGTGSGSTRNSTSNRNGAKKLVSGGTMAKLAGLAAMLEGLDGL